MEAQLEGESPVVGGAEMLCVQAHMCVCRHGTRTSLLNIRGVPYFTVGSFPMTLICLVSWRVVQYFVQTQTALVQRQCVGVLAFVTQDSCRQTSFATSTFK